MSSPILIDAATFTEGQGTVQGTLALNELDQRVWSHELLANTDNLVDYQVRGGVDQWQRRFLDVTVNGKLDLLCQRCLKPVACVLQERARVVLFRNEEQLDKAMMADESLDGVLFTPEMDLMLLLEDQILMAMPFAPQHQNNEDCANPQLTSINQDSNHPFAQLARLKSSH